MCGIYGVVSGPGNNAVPGALEALSRIDYRGYDSVGIAAINGKIDRVRAVGDTEVLKPLVERAMLQGNLVIAHTRWGTHGGITEANAHPHVSNNEVAVVHNGIIENYEELRAELMAKGYSFASETDSEVVPHLIHYYLDVGYDYLVAVREAVSRLKGAYALVIASRIDTGRLVAVRNGPPLLVGLGTDGNYVASDALGLVHKTRKVIDLLDGDIADITLSGVTVFDSAGSKADRPARLSTIDAGKADKGGYQYFMAKEIHEQPAALIKTLEEVLSRGIRPELFGATAAELQRIDSVRFLACGTSYFASRIGAQWLESIAKVPAAHEVASEYLFRDTLHNPRELIVTVSQSGETSDTMEALKKAKANGHTQTLSICNVRESSLPRASKFCFYTRAGAEVGVASTKAFTTQLMALFLLTLAIAKAKGRLSAESEAQYLRMLRELPGSVRHALDLEPQIRKWAAEIFHKRYAIFLGRGTHFSVALEGALKLKEITYIPAEAYQAGELKHGPLALVDKEVPVFVVAPNDELFDKLMSNIKEVSTRGAKVYVFTDEGSTFTGGDNVEVIRVPRHASPLSAVMHVVPLQLLAYHTALLLNRNIDKPRNLAKSVTVP